GARAPGARPLPLAPTPNLPDGLRPRPLPPRPIFQPRQAVRRIPSHRLLHWYRFLTDKLRHPPNAKRPFHAQPRTGNSAIAPKGRRTVATGASPWNTISQITFRPEGAAESPPAPLLACPPPPSPTKRAPGSSVPPS